jgi:hypothetical protein
MDQGLTPIQLAEIKKRSRALRVRNIRRRVAISAATIAAVFSGLILVRAEMTQLGTSSTSAASASVPTVTYDDGQATTTQVVPSSTDAETSSVPTTPTPVTSVPATVPQTTYAPAPTPPPVTTSQS